MAHYPYVNLSAVPGGCTTELTQLAAASSTFAQANNYLLSEAYYIGAFSGWSGCDLVNTNKPVSNFLPINNSNSAIKLPIDVRIGDTLKICGIASGRLDNPFTNDTHFGIALNILECGNPGNDGWSQTNILKEDFTFIDNHVCWSATYTFTGKYPACAIMFTLGFGVEEENKSCDLTWTFDLETVCVGPCAFEHTNVASHSILFNADASYNTGKYYGFSEKCGWRGAGDQFINLSTGILVKSYGHNGIKLPANLIPGDVIRLCGIASGADNNPFSDGSFFGYSLNNIFCSEAETVDGKDWPIYNLANSEYQFYGNSVCFDLKYTIPVGSPLIACDTMLVLGFGAEEIYKDCLVSYSLNVSKPCGSCTSEYTPIAQSSGNFNQNKISGTLQYYIGDKTCGWSGCSLNILQEIQRQEVSTPLSVDNTNCGIKLPFDLVQGDKIVICGTTTCDTGNVTGTGFFPALTKFNCSGYDSFNNQWGVSSGLAFGNSTFNYGNTACWSLEYIVPIGGLLACDTNLLLGLKCQEDAQSYKYSWTMNIVKLCPGPQEVGCCFTHAKTLFVDPNGNDLTALEGKQTKPWKSIGAAIEYLSDNTRTGYTIEVFPGDYPSEPGWFFDFKNTDTTIKLNGNVNVASANSIAGKGFIQVSNANIKIVGDDRTNSTFAYGGPGAYIQNNSVNDAIIVSNGTSNISISNVSMNNSISNGWGFYYEGDAVGGKLTLNEVSLLSIRQNIYVVQGDRPPVINIKDSVLYTGVNDSTVGYENILIEGVLGSYDPATWIFIENSRLVINGYGGAGPDSHIQTDCYNSPSIRGIFNGVLFYWKTDVATIYNWRDNSGNTIDVEVINPIVSNHDAWAGSFNMITGYGVHNYKALVNPSLYDG